MVAVVVAEVVVVAAVVVVAVAAELTQAVPLSVKPELQSAKGENQR